MQFNRNLTEKELKIISFIGGTVVTFIFMTIVLFIGFLLFFSFAMGSGAPGSGVISMLLTDLVVLAFVWMLSLIGIYFIRNFWTLIDTLREKPTLTSDKDIQIKKWVRIVFFIVAIFLITRLF